MRLIDADALWDKVLEHTKDGDVIHRIPPDFIDNAPTVDAEPVRHGRWDNIPNTYMTVASKFGSYSGYATSCSACREVNPNAYKTNYCPNCGAKMDGGGNGCGQAY